MSKIDVEQGTSPCSSLSDADSLPATDEYENLRVLLIGSHRGITSTIRRLYVLKFAEISDWSSLLPVTGSSEVMSILTRRIKRE